MTAPHGPKPGSFFLTTIDGLAGDGIWLAQFLAGRPSRFQHAGIVTDAEGGIVEAEPGGARVGNLSEYAGHRTIICDGPVQMALATPPANWPPTASITYEEWLRSQVVAEAQQLVGVPYSALDYAALAALHLHLPSEWIRDRVQASGHLICSQLVDLVYLLVRIHLFNDHPYRFHPRKTRVPGDVMPADLDFWARGWPQATWPAAA